MCSSKDQATSSTETWSLACVLWQLPPKMANLISHPESEALDVPLKRTSHLPRWLLNTRFRGFILIILKYQVRTGGLGICFFERSLDTVATVTKPKKLWAVMALLWQQEGLSRACQGPFRKKTCYGLHVKCPSQAQCANTWSSADRAVWGGCEPLGGGL